MPAEHMQRFDRSVIREFDYRPNRVRAVCLFLLVTAGEGLLIWRAYSADQGARIGPFDLDAAGVRILMGTLAALGPIGVVALGWLAISSLSQPRRIALTTDSIILPRPSWHGVSTDEIELPFTGLRGAVLVSIAGWGNRPWLRLIHETGIVVLSGDLFPSRSEFDEFVEHVDVLLKGRSARGAPPAVT